jgi:hypothetical protein
MKSMELIQRLPILTAIALIVVMGVLGELPIPELRALLAPAAGRMYGDMLADLVVGAPMAVALVLAAGWLGLGGRLGLGAPQPWTS